MKETCDCPGVTQQFVGSAVVVGASVGAASTVLHLRTFAGDDIDYPLDSLPDPEGAKALRDSELRPISVKIRNMGQRCSVIALAADGPRSSAVTLSTALALSQAGVHAVVEGGLRLELPCSRAERLASTIC